MEIIQMFLRLIGLLVVFGVFSFVIGFYLSFGWHKAKIRFPVRNHVFINFNGEEK